MKQLSGEEKIKKLLDEILHPDKVDEDQDMVGPGTFAEYEQEDKTGVSKAVLRQVSDDMKKGTYLVIQQFSEEIEDEASLPVSVSLMKGDALAVTFSPQGLDDAYPSGKALAFDTDYGYDYGTQYMLDVSDLSTKMQNWVLSQAENALEDMKESAEKKSYGNDDEYEDEMDLYSEGHRNSLSPEAVVDYMLSEAYDNGAKSPWEKLSNSFMMALEKEQQKVVEKAVEKEVEKAPAEPAKEAVSVKKEEPTKAADKPSQEKPVDSKEKAVLFIKPGIARYVKDYNGKRGFVVFDKTDKGENREIFIPEKAGNVVSKQLYNSARYKNWVVVEISGIPRKEKDWGMKGEAPLFDVTTAEKYGKISLNEFSYIVYKRNERVKSAVSQEKGTSRDS